MKLTALAAALLLAGCSHGAQVRAPGSAGAAVLPERRGAGRRAAGRGADRLAGLLHRSAPGAADRHWRWPTTATCAWRCSTSSRRARSSASRARRRCPASTLNAGGTRQRPSLTGSGVARASTTSTSASRPGSSTSSAASQSLKDAALAQFLATEEARKAVQISLVAAVASGWLALLADDELLEITRQTLATREESLQAHRSCASTTA